MKKHIPNFLFTVLLIPALSYSQPSTCGQPLQPQLPNLGTNVGRGSPYGADQQYMDLVKQGTIFSTANGSLPFSLDALGWPNGDFQFQVQNYITDNSNGFYSSSFWNAPKQAGIYNGKYKVSFNGQATVQWTGITNKAGAPYVININYNAGSNLTTEDWIVDMDSTFNGWPWQPIFINTRRTAGSPLHSGITNLKIIRPATDSLGGMGWGMDSIFTQPFLDNLKRYSTLRFMDATNTNNEFVNPNGSYAGYHPLNWSQRTHTNDAQWQAVSGVPGGVGTGEPWEICIALANKLNKDMWINIPLGATQDYVLGLANLLKSTLNPGLHVYFEISNEIWNGGFYSFYAADSLAEAEVNAGGSILCGGCGPNSLAPNTGYFYQPEYIMRLTMEENNYFKSVFGENNTTIRAVFGFQEAWPQEFLDPALDWFEKTYGRHSLKKNIYGIAMAPYTGIGGEKSGLTPDEVIQALQNAINSNWTPASNQIETAVNHEYTRATYYGLKSLCYEAGNASDSGEDTNSFFSNIAAWTNPGMKNVTYTYLKPWYNYGSDGLLNYFAGLPASFGKYGFWGTTADIRDTDPPIIQAFDSLLKNPIPITAGFPSSTSIAAALYSFENSPALEIFGTNDVKALNGGSYLDYLIRADTGGYYNFSAFYSDEYYTTAWGPGDSAHLQFYVDDSLLATINPPVIPYPGWPGLWTNKDSVIGYLSPGLHVLRILCDYAAIQRGYAFYYLQFSLIHNPIQTSTAAISSTCGNPNGKADVKVVGDSSVMKINQPYSYNWSNGASGSTASAIAAGDYKVTVSDINGCSTTNSVIVKNIAGGTVSSELVSDVSCFSGSNGSASANVSGGTPGYTYSWSNGFSSTTSSAAGSPVSGLSQGIYTVTLSDANNCTSVSTVSITQPLAIVIKTVTVPPACNSTQGSADVSASGGTGSSYSYTWDNGGSGPTITGVAAGSYTVTVTDANNCTSISVAAISNFPAPSISNLTGANPGCYGASTGSALVEANGGGSGLTYSWSNGASGATDMGLPSGTYIVSVTNASGCIRDTVIVLTEPSVIKAASTSLAPASCGAANGSADASASGGTGSFTFVWSNGILGATDVGLNPGTYTVTISDANGCSQQNTVLVNSINGGTVSASLLSNALCYGANSGSALATIIGGTPGYTYSWSNGLSDSTASGLSAGSYSVTVSDARNCKSVSTVNITQPAAILLQILSSPPSCNSFNGSSVVTASGGAGDNYSYSWNNGDIGDSLQGVPAGVYTVTATDANNCSSTSVAQISNLPAPSISRLTGAPPLCNGGNNGSATVSASGPGSLTYSWSNGGAAMTNTGLSSGTFAVSVTDTSGCIADSVIQISQPNPITASINPVSASCGENNGTARASAAGGTGAFSYAWSNAAGGAIDSTLSPGTYTLTVTDVNGCTQTSTAQIGNIPGGTASAIALSQVSCFGGSNGSAIAGISGGTPNYSFNWGSGAAGTGSVVSGLNAGIYTVTVTDAHNCVSTSTATITQPSDITLNLVAKQASCKASNGSATASATGGATGGYTYSWSNQVQSSKSNVQSSVDSSLAPGTYSITITDASGCTQTSTVTVLQGSSLKATVSPSLSLITSPGTSATLSASGGSTYLWLSPSSGLSCYTCDSLVVSPVKTTTYCVLVSDSSICQDSACTTITVDLPCGEVAIPNAFSPNEDGKNDFECVYGKCIETLHLLIFDRWGEKVFETNDPSACWDGSFRGKMENTGVFVYELQVTTTTGESVNRSGNISLLR